MIDKLVNECTETTNEVKLVSKSENKYNSCILYIALFSIFFTINVGIATYFIYYKYMNRNKENILEYDYVDQTENY